MADERLTSHVAADRVGPMPRGRSGGPPSAAQRDHHRARIDREAAAIILQDELDRRTGAASTGTRSSEPTR
jgi:RNase H-fold protein (predicted Holliday junction resolvase)